MRKPIRLLGKFQCKKGDFGFFIPNNKDDWDGDFFVHKKNFYGAIDGQSVAAEVMDRDSGKRLEVKITQLFSLKQDSRKNYEIEKVIEGIYSGGSGDFGFVDVPGVEKGFFVYGLKKNGAKDGDKVRANVKKYNGKDEAIIIEILSQDEELIEGTFSDNDRFGFVKPTDKSDDIFIAGSRKGDAKDGDKVEVNIIKKGGRRSEGVIIRVL